jgi:hypothetical protein
VRIPDCSGDVSAQVVADRVLVPAGGREQPLHPVRSRFPGMPGEGPAGLAFQPGQHPGQARPGTDPHFPAEEPARDQRERVIRPGRQPGRLNIVYPGQPGRPGNFSSCTPEASQRWPSRYSSGYVRPGTGLYGHQPA